MANAYTPSFTSGFTRTHYYPPKLDEEGTPIDPLHRLRKEAMMNCSSWWNQYQECVVRIERRTDGKGNCVPQHEELIMCQDHHMAHHLFDHVKTYGSGEH